MKYSGSSFSCSTLHIYLLGLVSLFFTLSSSPHHVSSCMKSSSVDPTWKYARLERGDSWGKSCLQTLENVRSLRSIIRLTGKDPNPENALKVPGFHLLTLSYVPKALRSSNLSPTFIKLPILKIANVQEGRLGNKIIEMTCLDSTR